MTMTMVTVVIDSPTRPDRVCAHPVARAWVNCTDGRPEYCIDSGFPPCPNPTQC